MRYEDASQTDSLSNELPVARDDADALAAGDRGPATGNVITGEGTQTGTLGTDALTAGAQVTSIDGAGGTDAEFSGGKLNVNGEFGKLSVDAQGNYSYLANQGAPETARDHFSYRLTDAEGNSDTARLTIEIGKTQAQVATQQVVVGPDGVVVLPAGVTLNDIRVVGRDLVVTLPDGSQMVIVDGAVFVPQLVLDNVEIPATNLAALLIDSEPRPAAGGEPPSSGGNFEVPVGPLDPGVPLGDLIPPTELDYTPPDFIDVGIDVVNRAPFASNDSINVSDEGLEAGIADTAGTPDTTDSATANGSILAGDEDGDDLTITLGIPSETLFSHGVEIEWALSAGGTVLTGSAGESTVIVVTMDSDGTYTVVQSAPIDHPDGTIEDGVSFVVPVNVSDGEEFVDVAITVTIEDDSPSVSNVRGDSSVLLDETDGANPLSSGAPIEATSEDAMIAADVSIGADGDGPPPVYGLSLLGGVTSLLSNVQTALGDFPITLTLTNSTLITATYNDGDSTETAFTIEMNPDGTVTVTQHTALEHLVDGPPGPAHDDALTLSSEALGNLVNATIVYEDFDGDTVAASTGIGDAITFEDDGPSIEIVATLPTDQEGPSPLVMTTTDDGTEGGGSTTDSTTADFGGVFSLGTSDGGADGAAGTPDIGYSLNLLVAEGSDSNLDSNGDTIFLYNIGGVVIGSTSAVEPASATDASVVFALSVNGDGEVTLTQYQQIDHPLQAAPNAAPFADQFEVLDSGLVELVATANIVDNDGDTDSDSESIDLGGYVRFADDGPDIDAALVADARIRIDETDGVVAAGGEIDPAGGNLGTVTMDLGTLFTVSTVGVSADAPTVNSYALTLGAAVEGLVDSGLQLSTTNDPIYLYFVGATVVGSTALVAPVSLDDSSIAFTVSINADGDVTLTQFLAVEHPIPGDSHDEDSSGLLAGALNVTVTATDFDGDTDTDSVDLGSIIRFEDDGPSVDVTANLTLEPTIQLTTGDAGTELGGSTSDSTTSGNFGGVFGLTFTTGSDGAATPSLAFTLGTPGGDSGLESHDVDINLYYIAETNTVVGSTATSIDDVTAGNTVFDVTVDAGGVVTLTQYQQIDHPLQAAPNAAPFADQLTSLLDASVTLTASSTITDNDLDTDTDSVTVNIGANLRFADDGPVIEGLRGGAGVTLDETTAGSPDGFPISDTSDFPMIDATVDYGADGEGPPPVYGLSLLGTAVVGSSINSGLATADGNLPITLTLTSATLITATYQDGGTQTAFTIQMNADGTVTVTQHTALEHLVDGLPGPAHDDALDLDNALGNLVNATVTYQDFDGDTATATAAIGAGIVFKDDGPNAEVNGQASLDTIILDESRNEGTDTPGGTLPNGDISATAAFADNFAVVTDFGADGEGSTSYSLLLSANGIASGLFALEPGDKVVDGDGYGQGASITLSQNAITGVITGSAGATPYFTLSIDSVTGVVTFTQINPIWHPTPGPSFDEAAVLNTTLAANVQVVQTVTDADGDTDTAAIDVGRGVFSIQDDGPSATTEAQQNVAEGATINGSFEFDAGVDGGGVTHINGTALNFGMDGFSQSIAVDDGTIKVKADGTYQFTATNPGAGVTNGTFTVTDGDGDTINANWSFNITDVNFPTAGSSTALLDDDGLLGGNPAGGALEGDINANAGEVATVNPSEAIFHGDLNLSFGGDGPGSINFASMDGDPGVVGTENVVYNWDQATLELTATTVGGTRPGTLLFTLELDDATSGEYTLTLNDNVLHAAGGGEASAPNVALTFTVIDSDNSPAGGVNGTLNITFNDDAPTLDVTAIEEEGVVLTTQDAETDGDPTTQDVDTTAIEFDSVFNLSFNAGADGVKGATPVLNYDLNVVAQNSGLTSHGQVINLFEVGGVVFGTTAAVAPASAATPGVVFSLAVSAGGVVTLTQYQQVDHVVEASPVPGTDAPFDDQFATLVDGKITLTGSATVTDGDDDVASDNVVVDLGGNIRFADDGPIANNDNIAQVTENTAVVIDVFANDEGGADGVDLVTGVELVPGSLSGSGDLVYNGDGTFTYTPDAGEDANVTFQYQITDFDGDTDVATATIDLQPDSVPQATAEVAFVDDDGLLGNNPNANVNDINANLGGNGDSNASEAIWSGILNATFGADVPGTFTFGAGLEGDTGTLGQESIEYHVSLDGLTLTAEITASPDDSREGTTLFTVQITNTNTGAYTVTLNNNVLHDTLDALPGDDTENPTDPTVVIPFTATDSDTTDSTTGNLTITFDDDMASINTVTTSLEIDNDATPSGQGDFAYSIGADNNTDFDDISVDNFTIAVNGVTVIPANMSFTPGVEDANAANYTFTFDYDTGTGGTVTAEGTLTFIKTGPDAGKYEVELTTGPIEGFTILDTGSADGSAFVEQSPNVTTVALAEDFHVQFTGVAGPNSTINYSQDLTPPNDGSPNTFSNGELLNATASTVQVSSVAAGVGGNTLQGNQGEVLDFNLYATDPGGTTGGVPTASSSSMFLTFDTVAAGVEDMIIVLKLYNVDTGEYTTRAVVVSNADLITGPRNNDANVVDAPPLPEPYQNIVLDNNDGFLVIESNDYNGVGENFVIVGAQIAAGDSGVVGTGINFNPAIGDAGGSSGTQAFSTDTHDGPFKITSVGFLTESNNDQNATIDFDVTVTDADGDSDTTHITAQIGDPPVDALAASTMAFSHEPANDTSSMSLLAADSGDQQMQKAAANNNSGVVAAAVAAAGLASTQAAAHSDGQGAPTEVAAFDMQQGQSARSLANDNDVDIDGGRSLQGNESRVAADDAEAPGGSASFDAQSTGQLVDDMSPAGSAPTELSAGTDAPASNAAAASMVAPMIVMPSVEALETLSANGNGNGHSQRNSVVEKVIADALEGGGGGGDVDALLAGLGGGGNGANAALDALASQNGGAVPVWDMGNGGSFQADVLVKIVTEAIELHHDAVQPAING